MKNKYWVIGLVVLFGMNIFAWIAVFQLGNRNKLEVDFFSVGQGDSEFIQTPQGKQILIDGGPDNSVLEKLGKVMPFWDRSIDLVILTHPEKDHLAGLIEVLKRYKIDYVLWNGIVRDTAEYNEWVSELKDENIQVVYAKAGEKIFAGNAEIDILSPLNSLAGEQFSDSNDTSVVTKLIYGENSFLFTGDLTSSGEKAILDSGENATADVLKVGHHGSKTSTSEVFLEAVSPQDAVIEVGADNPYGHPTQEVLDRLQNYGINILRTDLDGDIKFFSDGQNLNFSI